MSGTITTDDLARVCALLVVCVANASAGSAEAHDAFLDRMAAEVDELARGGADNAVTDTLKGIAHQLLSLSP